MVLLLTTTGRNSGRPHEVPLQYELVDGAIYVGAVLGQKADWFQNIVANPEVTIWLKSRRFRGEARPITDPTVVIEFLELRLKRHPKVVGTIMRRAGLPRHPTRKDLEAYAQDRVLVSILPHNRDEGSGFIE